MDENTLEAEGNRILQPLARPPSGRDRLARLLSPSPSPPPITTSSSQAATRTNEELMSVCRGFLDQLRQGTAPWVVQRLNNTYGPMPTDANSFSFWVALVLPIDEHEKSKLLPIRSARLRLRLVVHWIEQLNSNWRVKFSLIFYNCSGAWIGMLTFIHICRWFSSGCVIL